MNTNTENDINRKVYELTTNKINAELEFKKISDSTKKDIKLMQESIKFIGLNPYNPDSTFDLTKLYRKMFELQDYLKTEQAAYKETVAEIDESIKDVVNK